ncbi:MAG TPA: ATP-grasp domain-containing protein [Thermoleophilaceae bacterium]
MRAPDSVADPRAFAARIVELVAEHRPRVVYPGQEEALEALLAARDALPDPGVLPYPDNDIVQRVRSKSDLPELASGFGLAVPASLAEATVGEIVDSAPRAPFVVKPVRSGGAMPSSLVVDDGDDLAALGRAVPREQRVVLQERLAGPLVSLALVVAPRGRVVARFQQVARRIWPPKAGVSSLAVSVAPNDELVARSAAMLADCGFWGFVQLQFIDAASGPRLIDLNPRFYGSLPLALACGANLPAAWHAVAVGGDLPAPAPYRVGVTFRWLEADLLAALHREPGVLMHRAPSPRVGAIWNRRDPLPALAFAYTAIEERVRKRLPGL